MGSILFGDTLDMSGSATPSSGYFVAYDLDGVLKQKDEFGVISVIGSGNYVSNVIAGTGLSSSKLLDEVTVNIITSTGIGSGIDDIYIDGSTLNGDGLTWNPISGQFEPSLINGLEIIGNSIGIGGTLSQNTIINGDQFDFTLGNIDYIHITSSSFNVESNFVSIDSGTGSVQISGSSFSVNNIEIDPTSATTGQSLIYDGVKFLPGTSLGGITGITAGIGLSGGGGSSGFITLDVDLGTISSINYVDNATSSLWTALGSYLPLTGGTVSGNLAISGDLIISGTATYVYTENLYVKDNIITLNATYSGLPIPYSGIEVNVGNGTYSTILWDSSTNYWIAGLSGSESILIQESGIGLTKSGNELSVDLTENGGLTFSGLGSVEVMVDNSSIQVINGELVSVASAGDISGVTAGAGLTGGGNIGQITLDVDLIENGGLTFSGNSIEVMVDNSSIQVINGELVSVASAGDISGVTAGAGLTGGGNIGQITLDVNLGINGGLTFSGNDIIIDTNIISPSGISKITDIRSYTSNIIETISHNLNTEDITVQTYNSTGMQIIPGLVQITGTGSVDIRMSRTLVNIKTVIIG